MKYDLAAMNTSVYMVKAAVDGSEDAISYAFIWDNTPQGHEFWQKAYNGDAAFPKAELQEILDQINAENYGAEQEQ